ncbi:YkgJ family cysteine cluster protein [Limnobacter litoralis]|uniref:YkgJ family cysteine cluster protein n=1 Tax=Limnobacter litoralis TaxID=481366 RepID=A0ABQ5YS90_9BURK|nr:YkgJ family cysteine cluster protein [Limnobacter litoralis]GLR25307.1 hypothetical protein GCM10007875_03950 [Limnobacter litoralis]
MMSSEEQGMLRQSVTQVQKAAQAYLGQNPTFPEAVGFVTQIHSAIDKVVAIAVSEGTQLACRSGCSHCCHVRVEALEPEVFKIARFLQGLPQAALDQFTERLEKHAAAVDGTTLTTHRQACPFLENQRCLIYPIRPAVCRKGHSLDVQPCAQGADTLPQNVAIIAQSEAIIQGAASAYRAAGLPAGGHELGSAVLAVLKNSDAPKEWLAGDVKLK